MLEAIDKGGEEVDVLRLHMGELVVVLRQNKRF